jgi:hypothetical protein
MNLWVPKFYTMMDVLESTHCLPDYCVTNPPTTISFAYLATLGETIIEPQIYTHALKFSAVDLWRQAMDREYTSLIENDTCLGGSLASK